MIFNMESYKEQSTPETETLTVIVNSPGPVREGYVVNATTGETTASASFAVVKWHNFYYIFCFYFSF